MPSKVTIIVIQFIYGSDPKHIMPANINSIVLAEYYGNYLQGNSLLIGWGAPQKLITAFVMNNYRFTVRKISMSATN